MPDQVRHPEEIHRSEAAFFDAQAATLERAAWRLDPAVVARYRRPARFWFNKEYRFRRLGEVRGLRILDVGCGLGDNAILLASHGARVTAVDLSARSIELARRRAAQAGLAEPPEFVCAPLERAGLPDGAFDVIWGDGVLHHVLHDLDGVLERLVRAARRDARFLFSEPVDRVPGLRRLRLLLPVPPDGTPDERPLREAELRRIRRWVPDLRVRPFSFAGRLNRFLLPGGAYESAGTLRRAAVDGLCLADWVTLAVPGLARLGGMAVLEGHLRDAAAAPRRAPAGEGPLRADAGASG
ncbi:Methyltransferase type 11 [Anaeromyxobacter dehalogenans 2CP-1]|uniref:Methyltransferase type 11 n=1 Tax=Anaeromyxobacter dehalogenans (strain ATCC BAA-258 / DSM 21875 / 2CP-1) TaxID=455488 RepID=B8JC88_ANAD2|nr:class I SAM-dependent methyltransferase [Anaeromyxobacter dehalogenans]ACL65828.1 Methyltransferase type 11 [Anaeromyxobacter dehalogenans 2CP-1]